MRLLSDTVECVSCLVEPDRALPAWLYFSLYPVAAGLGGRNFQQPIIPIGGWPDRGEVPLKRNSFGVLYPKDRMERPRQ